jgi:hypothetical protein
VRPPEYASALEIRRIATNGTFSWDGHPRFLSETLAGADIAFEEIADGIWNIVYYRTLLGRFDVRSGRVTSAERPV